ncbi:hypothetical protein TNCT_192111 [Trichonephila clavata]|uniref:Uncharacterized protein n=1 Tax=Trichonephila clavata TaxID=2740835 RepID=A0A8X6GNV3_TRICU|nr:hypothetical protein TNCT_192111 [Trichonephila clavata]
MPSKLKAWLKAKLGFGGSSIPYKKFKDEHGSNSEEVKVESVIYYNCDHCGYRSSTQKGLRSHLLTCHKIGVGTGRTLDAYGHVRRKSTSHSYSIHAVWTQNLANQKLWWPQTSHISIYLHNMSRQWLFGSDIWSYQPLPGHQQVYLQHCTSAAGWTTSLVISATAWTPSSVSPALHFSGCLDYKSGHISHCRDTIKCISRTAIKRLFRLQVWSYQPLPGHHQVHLQHCTSAAVWTTSLVISATAWTPSSASLALLFSGCLDCKFDHIIHFLEKIKCVSIVALQWLFGLQVWSYQPLPGHHQVHLQCCTSVVVRTTSLLISPAK